MNRRALILAGLALPFLGIQSPAAAQDARELARISAYLNSISTLAGNFVQIDPDGVLSEGQFYMSRPGRIRFEYNEPNPALVVASARKPSCASVRALPTSHGLGITKQPEECIRRNAVTRSSAADMPYLFPGVRASRSTILRAPARCGEGSCG